MLAIRIANENDIAQVVAFYNQMIDDMADTPYKPGWKKDIYPTRDDVARFIDTGHYLIGTVDGRMAAGLSLNGEHHEGYGQAEWRVDASPEEVAGIHAVGVSPLYQGQGIAGAMLAEALRVAGEMGKKAVRLDVLASHMPAQKLYRKVGFEYIDTVQLYYEDTGLADFKLYEYAL